MVASAGSLRAKEARAARVAAEDSFRAYWRDVVRRWPPARRYAWLTSDEAVMALGGQACDNAREQIMLEYVRRARTAPSAAWLEDWWRESTPSPAEIMEPTVRVGAVRMLLSRELSRYGEEGLPSRRWTPPQAVGTEDFLDAMTPMQAEFYEHPASPSAAVIREIEFRRAVEA